MTIKNTEGQFATPQMEDQSDKTLFEDRNENTRQDLDKTLLNAKKGLLLTHT